MIKLFKKLVIASVLLAVIGAGLSLGKTVIDNSANVQTQTVAVNQLADNQSSYTDTKFVVSFWSQAENLFPIIFVLFVVAYLVYSAKALMDFVKAKNEELNNEKTP